MTDAETFRRALKRTQVILIAFVVLTLVREFNLARRHFQDADDARAIQHLHDEVTQIRDQLYDFEIKMFSDTEGNGD